MASLLTVDDLLALPPVPPDVSRAYGPGEQDDTVMLSYVKLYEDAAKKNEEVRLISLADTGHFDIVIATTPQWQRVRAALLELLEKGHTP